MKLLVIIFVLMLESSWAAPVFEFMDLQTHMTMSYPYPMFSESLREASEEKISSLTYKHQFTNVIYQNLLARNEGARILINGALAFEYSHNRSKIQSLILEQIAAVNDFARINADEFVVAKTPAEVRYWVEHSKKTIILHSIEGANELTESQEDADFWAGQGVCFITLIHLSDDEYGAAAHNPDFIGKILNLKGTIKKTFHPKKRRGLTTRGKNAIRWLARAGIMTDLSHMAPLSVSDSLDVLTELKLPALVTHSLFAPIHDNDRALTQEQLVKVYEGGGLFSLPISGMSVRADDPSPEFLEFIEGQTLCEGSLDSYRVSFQFTEKFLLEKVAGKGLQEMSEEERIEYSMGWQSDSNGWLNHSRPRYGKNGCFSGQRSSEFEMKGLAHPGLLPQYWDTLEKEGMNVSSLKYSSEKFLRMWEKFKEFAESN